MFAVICNTFDMDLTTNLNFQGDLEASGCNAKSGNPFGPFWDTFNVDFVGSATYGPLHYDVHNTNVAKDWDKKFPGRKMPERLAEKYQLTSDIFQPRVLHHLTLFSREAMV